MMSVCSESVLTIAQLEAQCRLSLHERRLSNVSKRGEPGDEIFAKLFHGRGM